MSRQQDAETRAEVERKLARHRHEGNIEDWRPTLTRKAGYAVTLFSGREVAMSLYEALAFTYGLDSAYEADQFRRAAELRARADYAAQKAAEAAEQRDMDQKVIEATGCPYCKQPAGQRCVREVEDNTPWAPRPHAARAEQAAVAGTAR